MLLQGARRREGHAKLADTLLAASRRGMGYLPAGGFQFAAKGLQVHFQGVTNGRKIIKLTSEHLNALKQKIIEVPVYVKC